MEWGLLLLFDTIWVNSYYIGMNVIKRAVYFASCVWSSLNLTHQSKFNLASNKQHAMYFMVVGIWARRYF